MKKTIKSIGGRKVALLIIGTLVSVMGHSQFTYYHVNNDRATNRKLNQMLTSLAAHNLENIAMVKDVFTSRRRLRERLRLEYRRNRFDRNSSFIVNGALKGVMAIGNNIMGSKFKANRTPYFTLNKERHMRRMNDNKLDLLWLQFMSTTNIRAGDRQEIYRLRREILRTHSKDERHVRSLVLLAAAAYAFQHDDELLRLLQTGEILL